MDIIVVEHSDINVKIVKQYLYGSTKKKRRLQKISIKIQSWIKDEGKKFIQPDISTYPKLISKKLETMASASLYSGLKSPFPNEFNIGQLLIL